MLSAGTAGVDRTVDFRALAFSVHETVTTAKTRVRREPKSMHHSVENRGNRTRELFWHLPRLGEHWNLRNIMARASTTASFASDGHLHRVVERAAESRSCWVAEKADAFSCLSARAAHTPGLDTQ